MPLKQTQHTQPAFTQAHTQSQHAWIMSQHALSPLVQVKHTPSLVIAQSHLHMHRLHWHIIMPFMVQHRLNIPPAIILHMFCRVAADISSSHVQVTFMPPAHFSTFIVQRGTMQRPCIIADRPGIWPCIGVEPDMPMGPFVRLRSIIIALDIDTPFASAAPKRLRPGGPQAEGTRRWTEIAFLWWSQSATPVTKEMPPSAWVGR